jgi:hemolysin activation/secretion protein
VTEFKLSQGLDVLDATKTGSSNLSRAKGHSDFTRIWATAGRLQTVTDNVGIYAAAVGQYAFSPLLSSEQFGFGGQQFGRAYDASELTGDDGMAFALELRYSMPSVPPQGSSELFAFWDLGRVWNDGDWSGGESGASAGVGIRWRYNERLSGNFTLAQPLTRKVADPGHGNGRDPRGFFSLNFKY